MRNKNILIIFLVLIVFSFSPLSPSWNSWLVSNNQTPTDPNSEIIKGNELERNIKNEQKFSCRGGKTVYLHEDISVFGNSPYEILGVNALSKDASDTATLIINKNDQYLGFLTSASFETGSTEPWLLKKYEEDSNSITAWDAEGRFVDSLIFNKETARLLWTSADYASPAFGLSSQAIYFKCFEL